MSRALGRFGSSVLLTALALGPNAASAHDQPYSYIDLHLRAGRLEGRVMAHVVDLARAAGIAEADSLLDPAVARRRSAELEAALSHRFLVIADGHRITPEWTTLERVPDRKLLSFGWSAGVDRAPGTIEVHGPLFAEDPQHETYVNVYEGEHLGAEEVLDRARTRTEFFPGTRQGRLALVRRFVAQGTHHIFIGPDHILFIVGLLLLGGGLGRLLKIVTAFTLAHSLTLALASLGIVNPPPRLIEPAIALSIVLVGAESLVVTRSGARARDLRVPLAFGFGLVHGFGFAGVLREFGLPRASLAWSLLSFNLGVELGQAAIVLAVAPVLVAIRARDPALAGRVVTAGSAAVIAAGGYWLVQRVFFPT